MDQSKLRDKSYRSQKSPILHIFFIFLTSTIKDEDQLLQPVEKNMEKTNKNFVSGADNNHDFKYTETSILVICCTYHFCINLVNFVIFSCSLDLEFLAKTVIFQTEKKWKNFNQTKLSIFLT
jgi:hypothetical protein